MTDALGNELAVGDVVLPTLVDYVAEMYVAEMYGDACRTLNGKQLCSPDIVKLPCPLPELIRQHGAIPNEAANEIRSVLLLMDGLTKQWSDEGWVFWQCRDRLRKLVEGQS